MHIPTIILGWLGIFIFLIIIISLRKLVKNKEYALLHLLMALMYAMWFPLPLTLYYLLDLEVLLIGTVFGFVYLITLVIAMALQTGHIAYVSKQNDHLSANAANNLMAMLSNPFEAIANIFKSIWALFLGLTFWTIGETLIARIMFLCSLLVFYYLCLAVNASVIKPITVFSRVKPNTIVTNVETFLFFFVLMIYITFGNI